MVDAAAAPPAHAPPPVGEQGPDVGAPLRVYVALWALVAGLAALPFLLVELPPIHDLPHHLQQVRLYSALGDPATSPYRTAWLAPQNLIYAVLVPLWAVLSPIGAGKAFSYLLLVATVAAVFHLAARRGRPAECALVGSLFAFNGIFYAGFYAFQLGGVLFLVWMGLDAPSRRSSWLLHAVLLAAVAWAHAFWLVLIGLVLLARLAVLGPTRARWLALATTVPAALWLVPNLLVVARTRASSGFPMGLEWEGALRRYGPQGIVDGLLGGLRGGVEAVVVIVVVAWIALGIRAYRGALRGRMDGDLLVAAGVLALAWAVSPDMIAMTLKASSRWLPYAAMLTVLALPAPRAERRVLRSVGAALAVLLLVTTAAAWRFYDRTELTGFREAMEALPEGASLLGLGLMQSRGLKGPVFFQTHAWSQILRGAEPDLMFTDLGAGLVLLRRPRARPWPYPLSLRPYDVRPEDFAYFDFALVAGGLGVHQDLGSDPRLAPVTDGLPWRLYRVLPPRDRGR